MKIEKWIYNGKEVNVPILENYEMEPKEEFDSNVDLIEDLGNLEDNDEH